MARARLLSPRGESSIAVVGIEGAGATDAIRALGIESPPAGGAIVLRALRIGRGVTEPVLVTRTGAGFELHVHGNPWLADRIIARIGTGRAARTLRGEILSVAARAPTRVGLRTAVAQLGSDGLTGLVQAMAAAPGSPDLGPRIAAALDAGERAVGLYCPPRLVLRGPTNAGKSTLFNLLFGRERVRTGPQRALTRDPVEEIIVVAGLPLCLVDTAGEGAHDDPLDRAAQELARHSGARELQVVSAAAAGRPASDAPCFITHAEEPPPWAEARDYCADLGAANETLRCAVGAWLCATFGLRAPHIEAAWLTARQQRELVHAARGVAVGSDDAVAAAAARLSAESETRG